MTPRFHRLQFFVCAVLLSLTSSVEGQGLELIVPAFANPGSDVADQQGLDMWNDLIQSSQDVGVKLNVILNPNSGPGGSEIDLNYIHTDDTPPAYPDFQSAPLVELRSGGADVFAYVPTGFGPLGLADGDKPGRDIQDVFDDIDRYFEDDYYRWAGVQINGIFLDEMSQNVSNLAHYQAIYDYIKTEYGNVPVIANPGLNVDEIFLADPDGPVADTLVIFEGTGTTYESWAPASWVTSGDYDRSNFAHIIHGEVSQAKMRIHVNSAYDQNAGMVFVGNDTGTDTNAYGQWPDYWQAEVEAVTSAINVEIAVSDNELQRSMLTNVEITLSAPVSIATGAFELEKRGAGGGSVSLDAMIDSSGAAPKVSLSFSGQFTESTGSLIDGNYQLTIDGSQIVNSEGTAADVDGDGIPGGLLVFGDEEVDAFYRLFADSDQNRRVDISDLLGFRQTYLFATGDASFDSSFDSNSDGIISVIDLLRLRQNFLKILLFDEPSRSRAVRLKTNR